MNLTVADMLVGVVTGPLFFYHKDADDKDNIWPGFLICSIEFTFPIASQVNLSLISLEWLHATRFPFRHCLITKWVYIKIMIASWLITLPLAIVMGILSKEAFGYAWVSFSKCCYFSCPSGLLYHYHCKCSKQPSFTTSWFNLQREETINNLIDSHWDFHFNPSALGYSQLHARRYKGKMAQCVKR